ncbi:cupin domain-containing protein [Streptomyces sp. RB6PN25]|uniref:Cupin domain-containing protein n=1 Tax=Streptomyces humicola TaxID=2953240 RepID=A0ABT1PPJ8_9ACTN|nr:cupin domain-containing protein [Streptomyces humicola]MCQ4079607.1 cupin domain-containing protein [Streptomyces humicola]
MGALSANSANSATKVTDGLVVPPGQGRRLVTHAHEVTFKVTGDRTTVGSVFEVVVPPGFDVGAHAHANSEELFYVIEGELELLAFEPRTRTPDNWRSWESASGARPVRATAGTVAHVPPGCPHAFANPTDTPARMLVQAAPPPAHERYFEELLEIFSAGGPPDLSAIAALRERYDIQQITPLRTAAP